MVSNVSALPPFAAAQTLTARAAPADEQAKPAETRPGAVAVDSARLEHREDVLAAREDVAEARDGIDFAIAVARQVRALLGEARDAAQRAADPATPDAARAADDVAFRAALQQVGQVVDAAIADGAPLIAGDALSVQADPDSDAAVAVAGLDLRLKSAVTGEEALLLTRGASVADRVSAQESVRAAETSLARLDAGLRRLDADNARLAQHDGILKALDGALGAAAAPDLDADGARLLALQVRQDLSRASAPIANAKPNAVLSLFRD
ncbi:MAG: hypothetical protein NW200_04005 [Hyphomonadaceae bacterium]|nr:hypothetical protein [Hyphomonadaceae bacterium]